MKNIVTYILLLTSVTVQAQCYMTHVYKADGSIKDKFIYDAANRPVLLEIGGFGDSPVKTHFIYESSVVRVISPLLGEIKLKYSPEGQVLWVESPNGTYEYMYRNGKLDGIHFKKADLNRTLKFKYSGNNINKVIFEWDGTETVLWEGLLFDDNRSRFPKELKDYDLIALSEVFLFFKSDFKLDYFNANNVMISRTLNRSTGFMKEIRYRYHYNEQSYPTQVRYTVDDDSFVAEYRFEYICN